MRDTKKHFGDRHMTDLKLVGMFPICVTKK